MQHIDASGSVVASHAFGPDGLPAPAHPVLVQFGSGVASLTVSGNTLHLFRAAGTWAFDVEIPLSINRDDMTVLSAVPTGDGGLLVELQSRDTNLCPGGLPCNRSPQIGVLRLSWDGAVEWRRDLDAASEAAFDDDGNAWLVGVMPGGAALHRVAANGNVSSSLISASADLDVISRLSAPVGGRILAAGASLESFGIDGQAVARVDPPQDPYVYPWDPYSMRALPAHFLVPLRSDPACHNAVLYHPTTLREQLRLHVDSVQCDLTPIEIRAELHPVYTRFAADDEGGLAFVRQECREGRPGPVIGRFGLPGTPAGGLLMRDGFEQPSN